MTKISNHLMQKSLPANSHTKNHSLTPKTSKTKRDNFFHHYLELFARLCGCERVFNHDEGIMRGWNGDKPWIIIYNHIMAEVIKY